VDFVDVGFVHVRFPRHLRQQAAAFKQRCGTLANARNRAAG
jgi:hypothetical protein